MTTTTNIELLDQHCANANKPVRAGSACPFSPRCEPLQAHRLEFLRQKWPPSENGQINQLNAALLAFGGQWSLIRADDSGLERLLTRGQFWGPTNRQVQGQTSACHGNSARYWETSRDEVFLATGYALSDDGLWRQHSWCLEPGKVGVSTIETTEERELYFGFVMDFEESLHFGFCNAPGGVDVDDAVRQRYEFAETIDNSQEFDTGEIARDRWRP